MVTRLVRWNKAMPQYHVGHLERVKRIEQAMDQVDGLSLMSNALHGVGIAPVIGRLVLAADWPWPCAQTMESTLALMMRPGYVFRAISASLPGSTWCSSFWW